MRSESYPQHWQPYQTYNPMAISVPPEKHLEEQTAMSSRVGPSTPGELSRDKWYCAPRLRDDCLSWAFPAFNFHIDIKLGNFYVCSLAKDWKLGLVFCSGKVCALEHATIPRRFNDHVVLLVQNVTRINWCNWRIAHVICEPGDNTLGAKREDNNNILVSSRMIAWTNPGGCCTPCAPHTAYAWKQKSKSQRVKYTTYDST